LKHVELINQFREEIAKLAHEVESSVAMGHFDLNKVCEDVICGLFRELFGFQGLRNLNSDEKANFPGIDLADDGCRVAIQVTSDKSLDKIKDTLTKAIRHRHYEKYDRFIVYLLTRKQSSYSADALRDTCAGIIRFDVQSDVLDLRDLSTAAAKADPHRLKAAVDLLVGYTRGHAVGLAESDFDPPEEPEEQLGANMVEVFFPAKLFIAEVIPEILEGKAGRKLRNHRKAIKDACRSSGRQIPSDFEATGGRLITFHDLEAPNSPFVNIIDKGTVEEFTPKEFYEIDEDHERVFKSLLRFILQQKLYRRGVMWQHYENKFIFLSGGKDPNKRSEDWTGLRASSRMVYERRFKRNKPDEVLSTKHFAFSVAFLRLEETWFVSLTPDWFFSYGDDYRRSFYGDKLLSGLKRMEKNRSVYDQFRFLASWLENIDRDDLFTGEAANPPSLSFGSPVILTGGRSLDEKRWEPLHVETEEILQERLGQL